MHRFHPYSRINKKPRLVHKSAEDDQDEEEQSDSPVNKVRAVKELTSLFDKRDDYSVYRHKNHIYFRTDVDVESINKMARLIDDINDEYETLVASLQHHVTIEPKPIYLHITTDGGCLTSGLLGSDTVANSKIPIHTIVEGFVASSGTLLSIAGKKRYMTENSYMLVHQLSAGNYGNFEQLNDGHHNNKQFMKHLVNIYKKNTKLTQKQLTDALKHDHYWDYAKCAKYGLVDEVYTNQ